MLTSYKTGETINYTTFFRYLIPDLVTSDRALYLDCNLVVTGDLSELFNMDMEEKPVAAVALVPMHGKVIHMVSMLVFY